MKNFIGLIVCVLMIGFTSHDAEAQSSAINFAIIGDFGNSSLGEPAVSTLLKSWNPDFIVTLGDNNYPSGASSTIDGNIGRYYHEFIYPYTGKYGAGASSNRFFPILGNHDWLTSGAAPYIAYFSLPGNERYYDFIQGAVHFFMLDSDPQEPDGITSTSIQGQWLQNQLANSTATWKVVCVHHAPYSSGTHGVTAALQWPYQEWGADIVLSGHDHTYERLLVNGFPYIVNGLGGAIIYNFNAQPAAGSEVRYNADYGAMLVNATETRLNLRFYSVADGGTLIDDYTLGSALQTPTPLDPVNTETTNLTPTFSWSVSAGAVSYEIRIGHSAPITTAPISVAGNTYTPPLPLALSTHYWQVRAVDAVSFTSTWSSPVSFTTVSPANAVPVINFYPTPFSAPTLTWNPVTAAQSYEIQVSADPTFTTAPDYAETVTADTVSFTTVPLAPGVYYWRVRAIYAGGVGKWSDVQTFSISGA